MEKRTRLLQITYISSLVAILITVSFLMQQLYTYQTYYPGVPITIDYEGYYDDTDAIDLLVKYSKALDINLVQVTPISPDLSVQYHSNISHDSRFKSVDMLAFNHGGFIANRELKDVNQVGLTRGLVASEEVRVFDFNQVINSGLRRQLSVVNSNKETLNQFLDEISVLGKVEIVPDNFKSYILNHLDSFTVIAVTVFLLIALNMLHLTMTYAWTLHHKSFIVVNRLQGHSKATILLRCLTEVIEPMIVLVAVSNLIIFCAVGLWHLPLLLKGWQLLVAVSFSVAIFLTVQMAMVMYKFIHHVDKDLVLKKPVKAKVMLAVSMLAKGTIILILILSIFNTYTKIGFLKEELRMQDNWKTTDRIFRIAMSADAVRYEGDLVAESEFNERCKSFYEYIKANNHGFIVNTQGFLRLDTSGEQLAYLYQTFLKSDEEYYSPYGHSMVIDEGYLKRHPLVDDSGKAALDNLIYDDNTLNVLVPERYIEHMDLIKTNFLDHFYFQKVTVDNIYRSEKNLPLNQQAKDGLSLNVIVLKSNQKYFTYSNWTGDENGFITDPLIMIYHDAMDASYLKALLTTSTYFEGESKDQAYFEIVPAMNESRLKEIYAVESVYSSIGNKIRTLKRDLIANLVLFAFCIIVFAVLVFIYCRLVFILYSKQFTVKVLNGLKPLSLRHFILILLPNALAVCMLLVLKQQFSVSIIVMMISMIEWITIDLMSKKMVNVNLSLNVKEG